MTRAWLTDLDARLIDRLNAAAARQPLSRRLRVRSVQAVSHVADHRALFFERQLGRRRLTSTFQQVRRAVGVSVWMYHLAQTDQLVCWSAV